MDGYTKAAIKEALAKRSAHQVKFDDYMERLVNGPAVYGVAVFLWVLGLGDLEIIIG